MPTSIRNCASELHQLLKQWSIIPPNHPPRSVRGGWPDGAAATVRAMALYSEVVEWLDRFEATSGETHPLRKSLPALFDGIIAARIDWDAPFAQSRKAVDGTALDQLQSFSYNLALAGVADTPIVYPSTPQTLADLRRNLNDVREFMLTSTADDDGIALSEGSQSGLDSEREQLRRYILILINHASIASEQLEAGAKIDLPSLAAELISALERFRDQAPDDDSGIREKMDEFITRLSPWAGVLAAVLQGVSLVLQIAQ